MQAANLRSKEGFRGPFLAAQTSSCSRTKATGSADMRGAGCSGTPTRDLNTIRIVPLLSSARAPSMRYVLGSMIDPCAWSLRSTPGVNGSPLCEAA